MKLKHKLSLIALFSCTLIILVVGELIINWQTVTHAMSQNKHAERVEFWVDKLESDFSYLQRNQSQESINDWRVSHTNLVKTLNSSPEISPEVEPLIRSIKSQNHSIKTLFDGLIKFNNDDKNLAIKQHISDKIIANIQTIREESRSISRKTKERIFSILTKQIYRTAPILLGGVIIVSLSSIYLMRWLNRSLLGLNERIELLHKGEIGSFYKPKSEDEFTVIYNKINELSRKLVETTISRDTLQNIVNERTKMLENLANTDPLTEIFTRRVLFQRGLEEFKRAKRHSLQLSLLMIDCDYFKKINDTYGHSTGDSVLIHLCRICNHEIRQIDIFARFGGEEFVIVLPETGIGGAQHIAKRIQQGINQNPLLSHGKQIKLTVSIGIAALQKHSKNFEQLIDAADVALFEAKNSGRNNIKVNQQSELG